MCANGRKKAHQVSEQAAAYAQPHQFLATNPDKTQNFLVEASEEQQGCHFMSEKKSWPPVYICILSDEISKLFWKF